MNAAENTGEMNAGEMKTKQEVQWMNEQQTMEWQNSKYSNNMALLTKITVTQKWNATLLLDIYTI